MFALSSRRAEWTLPSIFSASILALLVVIPEAIVLIPETIAAFNPVDPQPAAVLRNAGVSLRAVKPYLQHYCDTFGGMACQAFDITPSSHRFEFPDEHTMKIDHPFATLLTRAGVISAFVEGEIANARLRECRSLGATVVMAIDQPIDCLTHEATHRRFRHEILSPVFAWLPANSLGDWYADLIKAHSDLHVELYLAARQIVSKAAEKVEIRGVTLPDGAQQLIDAAEANRRLGPSKLMR